MRWEQKVEYASLSDVGFRRQNNQDCATVLMAKNDETWHGRGHLFVVADGMGGHAVGELASKIAVDTIPHTFHKLKSLTSKEALRKSIETANTAIHERGQLNREFHNMGTTCTTLVLAPEGAFAGHVGDSRLYRIRDQRIDQLTFDHSLQWELIKEGKQKKEEILRNEPRNVITRCLGPGATVNIDVEGPHPVLPGDVYLLCSDGLTGVLSDADIGTVAGELPPADACRLLINLANLRGGTDNITVLIARVGDIPEGLADIPEQERIPVYDSPGFSWGWVLSLWALGALVAVGISLSLFEKPVEGVLTLGLAALCATMLGWAWWKSPKSKAVRRGDETVISRPYRTASSRLTRKFLDQLAALAGVLQQTATGETWKIDWVAHKTAADKARHALEVRDYPSALRELAKTLQVLMAGIQHQRRRMDYAAKWSTKPAVSKPDPGASPKP